MLPGRGRLLSDQHYRANFGGKDAGEMPEVLNGAGSEQLFSFACGVGAGKYRIGQNQSHPAAGTHHLQRQREKQQVTIGLVNVQIQIFLRAIKYAAHLHLSEKTGDGVGIKAQMLRATRVSVSYEE